MKDLKTRCGHSINVRCLRCAADYDPIQPRRWVKLCKLSKTLNDRGITPEEARTAVLAIVTGMGMRLDLVREFDNQKDEFALLTRDSDGVQGDIWIPAEIVAQAVIVARTMSGAQGAMLRPSEMRERARAAR